MPSRPTLRSIRATRGALVNMNGELVGINSAIATLGGDSGDATSGSIGLGFAIPVDQAKRIADELISSGTASHASLGVQVSNDMTAHGAKIVEVVKGWGRFQGRPPQRRGGDEGRRPGDRQRQRVGGRRAVPSPGENFS